MSSTWRKVATEGSGHAREVEIHALLTDLKTCSFKKDIHWGRRLHATAAKSAVVSNMHVATALIKMYAKCRIMVEAQEVFDSMQKPDVVSWTALLLGYAESGEGHIALDLFSKMKAQGFVPDCVTYVAVFRACKSLVNGTNAGKEECLQLGRKIHSEIRCNLDHYVQSTLIDMYTKCGSMIDARRVFDSIQKPDVVNWTALLMGYAENGEGHIALDLFSKMKEQGCLPDSVAYVAALKSCTSLALNGDTRGKIECLERGRVIHAAVGCHLNNYVQGTLIDMYAKCDSMSEARRVFDSIRNPDLVSWNALLLGYAENGEGQVALDLFSRMKAGGRVPDCVTYVAALKACTSLEGGRCLERGKQIHLEVGSSNNNYIQGSLIDMYAKCGSMLDARCMFDSIRKPDVVSWNSLLMGYADNGEANIALDLFSKMKKSGCVPTPVTYVAALRACESLGALSRGRKIHSEIKEFTTRLVTCLVDFYAKCGSIFEAREVFDKHRKARNVLTWTALLAGYSSVGDRDSVFGLFDAMVDEGVQPDAVTFVSMLLCCSHAGLVEKAQEYFEAMPVQYGVTRIVMHYNCMVDVLGRANQLNGAIAVIRKMPLNPDTVIWMTMLGACRKWKNAEIGSLAFRSLVHMDTKDSSSYVLMAQIYGRRGMFEEQQTLLGTTNKVGSQTDEPLEDEVSPEEEAAGNI